MGPYTRAGAGCAAKGIDVTVRFPDGELGRSASIGGVTDRSVRVWLRDPAGEEHTAIMDIDGKDVASVELRPTPDHDWIDAADLTLDRTRPNAAFRVRVAGVERHGRLAPEVGAPATYSFGFSSCNQPFENGRDGNLTVHPIAKIYRAISRLLLDRRAHFMLMLGDQIYSDGVDAIQVRQYSRDHASETSADELRDIYRFLYRGYFNESSFRALVESVPSIMVWDDHDVSDNWGSYLDWEVNDDALFQGAQTAYREYQYSRQIGAGLDDEPPYHHHFWFGDTGFFLLDLRGVRDYREGRALGRQQWRDLVKFLADATDRGVTTLFIAASIPVVHHAPYLVRMTEWLPTLLGADIRDRWASTPIEHERTALLERLFDWQCSAPRRHVILLSGDVHAGAAFRIKRRRGRGTVWQWTSSPLTTRASYIENSANRLGTKFVNVGDERYHAERRALVTRNNVGLVQVTPEPGGGHRVALALHAYRTDVGLRIAAHGETWPSA